MNRRYPLHLLLALTSLVGFNQLVSAQVEGPNIPLRRGMLWNTYHYTKTCAPFSNWSPINYGLDWPGYEPEWIRANIGGAASYLTTGGIWFGVPDPTDASGARIYIEDWSMYGGGASPTGQTRYRVTKHAKRWPNGENYWGQTNPREAEELIESEWVPNPAYVPTYPGDAPATINVKRNVRQWSGSQRDENYVLVEYLITNTSDTLVYKGAYAMVAYAIGPNARAWRRLFPGYNAGPRNTRMVRGVSGLARMMFGYADDTPLTPISVIYGRDSTAGPEGKGEYLSPGYAGFKLLYSSPDTVTRAATRIKAYSWYPAPDQQDLYGPFGTASAGTQYRYSVIRSCDSAQGAITSETDPLMRSHRMWTLMSLGPWTIRPHDTIKVVLAEFVAGVPYETAVDTSAFKTPNVIGSGASQALTRISRRTQIAYDSRFNLPRPPAAPEYSVRMSGDATLVGNIIEWSNQVESILDPDYTGAEAADLAGYRLYRSSYLPIGPFKLVADVKRGDPTYFSGSTYRVFDSTASVGEYYYYAVTAYDTGHATWPINRTALFPETNSNRVPPMESSVYASLYSRSSLNVNYVLQPFQTTIPPASRLTKDSVIVSPNPFRLSSGSAMPDKFNFVQFIHVPSPSTIRIYTIRGDLVKTITHTEPSGITTWNLQSDYGQYVVSGMYVYHIETPTGERLMGKIGIVR